MFKIFGKGYDGGRKKKIIELSLLLFNYLLRGMN